jgi:[acyl-carrier-protein] S-malonyltransferase
MGRALAQADPAAAAVFAEADEILGFSLSQLCWQGPLESLNDTLNTQPALLTHSVAVLRALQRRAEWFRPALALGHSLGEISALVAAGAIGFADALHLVRERGRAMKAAGEQNPGGMAAVLGLDIEAVAAVCRDVAARTGRILQVANDNCPGQAVISGEEAALVAAVGELQAKGARRVVRLAVSIPAHSPLMEPAQAGFNRALDGTPLIDPLIPVIGNVEAAQLGTASEVQADLSAQLTSRVRWAESIRAAVAAGIRTFLEIGTGNVLTDLVRRIDPACQAQALDEPESYRALSS